MALTQVSWLYDIYTTDARRTCVRFRTDCLLAFLCARWQSEYLQAEPVSGVGAVHRGQSSADGSDAGPAKSDNCEW